MIAIKHVPIIEHQLRVIKERAHPIRSTLPFEKTPKIMIVVLINFVVLWMNAFPPLIGISDTFTPSTITTGTALDYKTHCKLPFGEYIKTHEDNTRSHTMDEHTRHHMYRAHRQLPRQQHMSLPQDWQEDQNETI
jgi:hypothetical protein